MIAHLVLDIGGGSTELILADGRDTRALTSTRVGAVRLQRDFVKDDDPPQRRSFACRLSFRSLEPAVDKVHRRIKPGETPVLVATSGTAMAIGPWPPLRMIASVETAWLQSLSQRLNRVVEACDDDTLISDVVSAIDDRRAEIIVPDH